MTKGVNMNKTKNSFKYKMILDLAMVIVLSLLFRKNTLGMAFHEIAGLIILAVFIFHVVLNRKWVAAITSHLFTARATIRAKICWLIDAVLAVCFVLIGLSGILMSKVVFHFNVAGNWKTLHYFCAALALILAGAHLGMHGAVIGHSIARLFKKTSGKTVAVIFGIVSLIIIVFGAYSLTATSFSRWITMPFETQSAAPERMPNNFSDEMPSGDNAMMAHGGGDKMQMQQTPGSMILGSLQTFIQFFSIMYFFAAITCVIDMIFMKRKKTS